MSSYSLIFATPSDAPVRFVSHIHDSILHPISISKATGWCKPPKQFQQSVSWTNLVLLPGEDARLPRGDDFRMQHSWRISFSETPASRKNGKCAIKDKMKLLAGYLYSARVVPQQPAQLGHGKAYPPKAAPFPDSLKAFRDRYLMDDSPMITVLLLNLLDDASRHRYQAFMKDVVRSLETSSDTKIHAADTIQSSTGSAAGLYNEALLIRYSSVDHYAQALEASWWEELVRSHDLEDVLKEHSAELLVKSSPCLAKT